MSLFKKIFELSPEDVEAFIINRVKNMWVNYDGRYDDYDIEIKWIVPHNEFYVHLEPKLQTKDWQVYSFKDIEASAELKIQQIPALSRL
jgi:hypothetical protein